MTDKPWKLILLLVGIFAAGVVTGSLVTVSVERQLQHPRDPGMEQFGGAARLKMLADRLELTPAQQQQLGPIVRRDMEELVQIRLKSLKETRRVLEQMNKDIAAVLTPEQKVKFDAMNRQVHERFQRFMRERPPGGGPGRGGPGGPGGPDGPGGPGPSPDHMPGDMPPMPPEDKSPDL